MDIESHKKFIFICSKKLTTLTITYFLAAMSIEPTGSYHQVYRRISSSFCIPHCRIISKTTQLVFSPLVIPRMSQNTGWKWDLGLNPQKFLPGSTLKLLQQQIAALPGRMLLLQISSSLYSAACCQPAPVGQIAGAAVFTTASAVIPPQLHPGGNDSNLNQLLLKGLGCALLVKTPLIGS